MGQITVLFGINSSGKSSLLQSILLLKQTVESFDRSRVLNFGDSHKNYVELGDYKEAVYAHKPENKMELKVSWNLPEPVEIGQGVSASDFTYNGRFQLIEEKVILSLLRYSAEKAELALQRKSGGAYTLSGTHFHETNTSHSFFPPESCYGIPSRLADFCPSLYPAEFSHQFENVLRSIFYLGPLRQQPERVYTWSGSKPDSVGLKGENAVQAMLAVLKETLYRVPAGFNTHGFNTVPFNWNGDITFDEEINKWMKQLGIADNLRLVKIDQDGRLYDVRLIVQGASYETSLADVGVGVSQILPVIVQLYFAPPGSILIFEQPEIHLHPSVQAAMADLFIEAAGIMGHQIIIESHSEHFLVRMQRRIAESRMKLAGKEHIRLYFCYIEDDSSCAKELDIDDYGRIENWPGKFFGDTLGDREAIMRALVRRKTEEKKT
ncbi:MAG: DUF3696 domain-containing protein [Desulfobacterales bacterium]|nr:DUF3696 domain-containing protein [Desulfobacterales bacterium]